MKPKILLAIGIALSLGATLWMRQVASWRPQVVARLGWKMMSMTLSRDGRRMLVWGEVAKPGLDTRTVVIDLERIGTGAGVTSDPRQIRAFWKNNAGDLNLRLDPSQTQLIFTPPHGKPVLLEGKIVPQSFDFDARGEGASSFDWNKTRHEIRRDGYGGEFRIWDSRTGRLKGKFRNSGDVSPDGRSSLAFTLSPRGVSSLIRYAMPSGKFAAVIDRSQSGLDGPHAAESGWSPDGKYICFVRQDSLGKYLDFNVVRASDSKPLWSVPCAGSSQWLPDGRIGLMQKDGFSFRDASGRETSRALGPLPGATPKFFSSADWQISPDGKWIYEADDAKGLIRRWRAK